MQSCMMHMELRIAGIDSLSLFDAESFVRMHQLSQNSPQVLYANNSLVRLPRGGVNASDHFKPQVKVQFVFENLVRIESSTVEAVSDRRQHEEQIKSKWDASEIRTKRFHCNYSQAIIASLPRIVVERYVKIRVLQLAPLLSKEETIAVGATFPHYFNNDEPSLCVGVAKISLRDLIATSGGVSVTLQPKRSMIAAVESLNLNAVATNAMFGKDAGGSGVLTFQVVSVVFNPKTLSSMLCCPDYNDNATPTSVLENGRRMDNASDGAALSTIGPELVTDDLMALHQQMNSGAVRFVLVPYMVLADAVLRFHDAFSWRNPLKTLLLLCIICVVISVEVVDMGLVFAIVSEALTMVRTMVFFYRVPPRTSMGPNAVQFLAERKGTFQAVLYGSHNHVINSLIRARLFFTQGLQPDCYFELVYLFYRLKKLKRGVSIFIAALVSGSILFSFETFVLFGMLFAFLVYPLLLRFSHSRLRKTWRRQLTSGTLWKTISLSRSMPVARVVQVIGPHERCVPTQNFVASTSRFSTRRDVDELKISKDHSTLLGIERPAVLAKDDEEKVLDPQGDVQGPKLPVNYNPAENSFSCTGGRNAGVFGCNSLQPLACRQKLAPRKSEMIKHEPQQPLHLTFVAIVIGSEVAPACHSRTTSINGTTTNITLVQRLWRVFQRAGALGRPPPSHLLNSQYQSYFNSVLTFLQFVGRQCTLDAYMSVDASSTLAELAGGTVKLDQVAPLCNLLEVGKDDGITSTLLAHSGQQIVLSKLQLPNSAESSARALALLAAYLLQGSRLSVYSEPGGKVCSVIIPLKMDDSDIETATEPHPCPAPLQKALVGFWKGLAGGDCSIDISPDVVLTVITTYKDTWNGDNATTNPVHEYNHISGQNDDNSTNREVSKRLMQTLNPTQMNKRYSMASAELPPLDTEDKALFFRHAGGPVRPDDSAGISPRNYHRATRTWA
ncbi:hypothetical protein, conserved [Trypanosoma brucei gambiense DAL972]|uniref:Transmembrane protein n=1 Tax=Trypanosoma brucei gambiense (strain MHOM/CI/86/DAL972) TaxID=679716 RepID=D0A1T0_TRYB9|nr:hypothetical protein, conserved [Trypanosoma brucei gambiense DAL972]CBH15223.1 hypothetical protein, conserved [Trypanosoma brucei gambiense DAL972]|eukprot:XP_011777488.1 hypothetical protein, conserved [Trypanosoma brucei gambiense DAL972]